MGINTAHTALIVDISLIESSAQINQRKKVQVNLAAGQASQFNKDQDIF